MFNVGFPVIIHSQLSFCYTYLHLVPSAVAKLMWFRTHMDEDKQVYSPSDMVNLIERYMYIVMC